MAIVWGVGAILLLMVVMAVVVKIAAFFCVIVWLMWVGLRVLLGSEEGHKSRMAKRGDDGGSA